MVKELELLLHLAIAARERISLNQTEEGGSHRRRVKRWWNSYKMTRGGRLSTPPSLLKEEEMR